MSLFTKVSHGLTTGDRVVWGNLDPSDCGLVEGQVYYVLTTPDADTFTISETDGGTEFDLTFDLIDGTLSGAAVYTAITDPADVMAPPTEPPTATAPTVDSALVSGIVRLRIVLNDTAEPKVREYEVQVTHKYDVNGDPDWTTPFTVTIPAGVAGGEEASIPALGNTNYTVRVRAVDVYGNFGDYSTEVDITTIEGSDSLTAALAAIANGVDGEVIDATNIQDNAIETRHIKANAVTADALAATLVLASLIQTSATGRRVEIDTAGIRLVDADDSVIVNIPTDSEQPVYFKGEVVAESFVSQQANDLSGEIGVTGDAVVTLANGVSAPTVSPTVTAFQNQLTLSGGGSTASGGMGFDAANLSVWVPADPATGFVAHEYLLDTGEYVRSIEATGSSSTVTTTYGSTSHISDTAEATDSASETQIATPIVMPRDGRITKVSIYLAGHNDSPSVRNCVWSNGGTLIDNSASYTAANEGATGVGDSHQYNKTLANGTINYNGGTTYKVGAMLTSDGFVGWQWDRDDGSGKTTYLGSGENFDDFTVTRTETTHKPNVYITYEYDVDSRLETLPMIGVATDGTYVYTLDTSGVVWKYDRTTGSHVAHSGVQTAITGTKANAGLFYDSTATELIITTATTAAPSAKVKFVRVNPSTLAVSSSVYSASAAPSFDGSVDTFRGGFRLADPLNASAATYWVQTYTSGGVGKVYAFTFSGSTATPTSDRDFGQGTTIRYGILYDDTNQVIYGRYSATLYAFTDWDWTTDSAIYWFAHAWYDSAGTTHETAIGPRTSLTLRRRENVRVSQGAIPTGGADDPNNVRIYFKPNATDPGAGALKLQATDALTSRDFDTYDSGGAADGGGTPFPAGTPAEITDAGGVWSLKGDGSASFGDVDAAGVNLASGAVSRLVTGSFGTLITSAGTSSDTGTTSVEATGVPSTGVVALVCRVRLRNTGGTAGSTLTLSHFTAANVAIQVMAPAQNRDANAQAIIETGGTNNRQIKWSTSLGSQTCTYDVFVVGYYTTE